MASVGWANSKVAELLYCGSSLNLFVLMNTVTTPAAILCFLILSAARVV